MSTPSGFLRGTRALFAAAKSTATKKPTIAAAAAALEKKKSTSGILKPVLVSPTLRGFVGSPEISRAEAVKKVWEYIKLHELQNPINKREIVCDAKLKKLFDGKDKVGFLEVAKLLSPHFVKTS